MRIVKWVGSVAVVLNPKEFNYKAISWLIAILAGIVIWAIFVGNEEDDKFLQTQAKAELNIHAGKNLAYVDLDKDDLIGKQEFHIAVLGKQFIVKGLELTLVRGIENTRRTSFDNKPYKYFLSSAVVNPTCLEKIKASLPSQSKESLSEILRKECSQSLSPFHSEFPSDEPLTEDAIRKACKEGAKCSNCIFIVNEDRSFGQCNPREIVYFDQSNVMTTQGKKSVNIQYRDFDKLAYR